MKLLEAAPVIEVDGIVYGPSPLETFMHDLKVRTILSLGIPHDMFESQSRWRNDDRLRSGPPGEEMPVLPKEPGNETV